LVLSLLALLVAALAVWEAVEIWHHGEIFAGWRAWLECGSGFFARLLLCPFCLAVWVALPVTILLLLAELLSPWWGLPAYLLAAARLSNLGNDITHDRWCRTPRYTHPSSGYGGGRIEHVQKGEAGLPDPARSGEGGDHSPEQLRLHRGGEPGAPEAPP
jgi:hypothetical protein